MRDRPTLPHRYPFRLVETVLEDRDAEFTRGRVRASVTANGRASMGAEWSSPVLLAEAVAQAALLLQGGGSESASRGYLAGIDAFETARAPRAGEVLTIDVRLAARFGRIVRFEGEVSSGGEVLAHGGVLVREGDEPSAAS